MIDVVRGGHNFQCPGARALLDETIEDRNVCAAVISNLKATGDTVIDATPGNCDEHSDLVYGTNVANNAKANIFVPIHFNNAYKSYTGAIGCEVWINPNSATAVATGTRVVNNLQALGFKNRGLKDGLNGQRLHDVRATSMTTVLVEVCFVEATEDVALYKKLGAERVGKAIAEAIKGHSISGTVAKVTVPVPATRVNNSIAQLQAELNRQGFGNLVVDGFYGTNTLAACPTTRPGAQGNITKWLQKRLALPTNLQTGFFGDTTKNAIIKYQSAMGLSADGIVGQGTWASLLK
ncbi:N-acetylmuramoyl-L-alanine amidase [Clostridium tagluense]|uniref:N-acetylmuramoyl-L-alanine amidase n=1 Tax=Clostridium tagluense TaxID=360422 RepID=UPI001C6F3E6C|nr:N-acetylmuramoyl-L-alanine amidase [Clostridium tagluense]MBW9157234.1 N-acetylmuramoyl-L-alanine amidase [Clostridium tagluense]WLC67166.1 N-acetylmuramoyl-L-alanine amidase [Clostridium tagluense]